MNKYKIVAVMIILGFIIQLMLIGMNGDLLVCLFLLILAYEIREVRKVIMEIGSIKEVKSYNISKKTLNL